MNWIPWGVELDGIEDLAADLSCLDDDKCGQQFGLEPCSVDSPGLTNGNSSSTAMIGGIGVRGEVLDSGRCATLLPRPFPTTEPAFFGEGAGEVLVLSPNTLQERFVERMKSAPFMPNPFDLCTVHDPVDGEQAVLKGSFFEKESKHVLKVFFPCVQNAPVYFSLHTENHRKTTGAQVLTALLSQALRHERESMGFSSDETRYELFVTDSEGNKLKRLRLEDPILEKTTFTVQLKYPKDPLSKNQRKGLLPMPESDICFFVYVQFESLGTASVYKCVFPAEILTRTLEIMIRRQLPAISISPGSLRIIYRNEKLPPSARVDLGPGVGGATGPLADHTVLTLYRCGVKEVEVEGHYVE